MLMLDVELLAFCMNWKVPRLVARVRDSMADGPWDQYGLIYALPSLKMLLWLEAEGNSGGSRLVS